MFSDGVLLILWLIGLILCIFLKTKFDLNFGVAALVCAYIIGCLLKGLAPSTLISSWSTTVLFVFISTGMFFGFAALNGTLKLLAEKMLYLTRGVKWFPPIALFLISFLVSTLGAGSISTNLFIPPIGFAIAAQAGFNPLLVSIACCLGACCGGGMPWASGFASRMAYLTEDIVDPARASDMSMGIGLSTLLIYGAIFAFFYFVFRGYKSTNGTDMGKLMKRPEPFNPTQRKTLILIGCLVVCVMLPVIIKTIDPKNAFGIWGSKFIYLQFLCLVFAVIAFFLNLADFKAVCNRIPWMTMVQAGGAGVYVKVAVELGLADVIGNFVATNNLPGWLCVGVTFLLSGALSFVSGFYTIMPLFMGMAASIAAASGCTTYALANATYLGCMLTAFSPFSTCGAMQLAGCMDDEMRESIFMKQFYTALAALGIGTALACIEPLMNLFFTA